MKKHYEKTCIPEESRYTIFRPIIKTQVENIQVANINEGLIITIQVTRICLLNSRYGQTDTIKINYRL